MEIDFIQYGAVDPVKYGGNALGYGTGRALIRQAVEKAGIGINKGAEIAFHYAAPHFFSPIKNKVNVFFTMWEAVDLPSEFVEVCNTADFIIVPSKFSKDVIKKQNVSKTIYVCPHPVDTEFYWYRQRKFSKEDKIRFLWLGAPTLRKGYDIATKAFCTAFADVSDVELYLKTSYLQAEGEKEEYSRFKNITDTRKLSKEDLRELYWSSHVFLSVSRGEGVNLPALEAMSSGIPVIAAAYSGMKEFMRKEFNYPVKYNMVTYTYGVRTKFGEPDLEDTIEVLRKVHCNMRLVLKKGRLASLFVNKEHSVASAGIHLVNILDKIKKRIS